MHTNLLWGNLPFNKDIITRVSLPQISISQSLFVLILLQKKKKILQNSVKNIKSKN